MALAIARSKAEQKEKDDLIRATVYSSIEVMRARFVVDQWGSDDVLLNTYNDAVTYGNLPHTDVYARYERLMNAGCSHDAAMVWLGQLGYVDLPIASPPPSPPIASPPPSPPPSKMILPANGRFDQLATIDFSSDESDDFPSDIPGGDPGGSW